MTHEVLVDASAWIAINNTRDKYHAPATQLFQQFVTIRQVMVTTNLVIAEAYASIRKMGGHVAALDFLEICRQTSFIRRVYSDAALELQAEAILRQFSDQDFSLADAVSFALMRQLGITEAFTFDHHFLTAGFAVVPAMG